MKVSRWYKTAPGTPVTVELPETVSEAEDGDYLFGFRLFDGETHLKQTGQVTGKIGTADGEILNVTGAISGFGDPYIAFPAACYIPGRTSIEISLNGDLIGKYLLTIGADGSEGGELVDDRNLDGE